MFREPDPLSGLAALISPPEIARKAKERIDTFERLRRRSSWSTWVEPEVLRVVTSWEDQGAPELLPVVDGRPIRRERARRWRCHMLDGTAANPGEDARERLVTHVRIVHLCSALPRSDFEVRYFAQHGPHPGDPVIADRRCRLWGLQPTDALPWSTR